MYKFIFKIKLNKIDCAQWANCNYLKLKQSVRQNWQENKRNQLIKGFKHQRILNFQHFNQSYRFKEECKRYKFNQAYRQLNDILQHQQYANDYYLIYLQIQYNPQYMKSKTTNNFRLKIKNNRSSSREQHSLIHKSSQDGEPFVNSFSEQYISLAQKCHIKILANQPIFKIMPNNNQNLINQDNLYNKTKSRFKTDFSRRTHRYKVQFLKNQDQNKKILPLNIIQSKYQSISVYSGSINPSKKNDKHLFSLLNHIQHHKKKRQKSLFTHYSNDQLDPLINQDVYRLKLIIKHEQQQNNLKKLSNHTKKLLAIKKSLEQTQQHNKYIIREIKQYILKQQGCSLSKLTLSIEQQQYKKMIKKLILYQRIIIISIVNIILHGKFQQHQQQVIRSIQIILGFWYQIINHTYQEYISNNDSEYDDVRNVIHILSQAKLLTKSNLRYLLQTIIIKIHAMNKQYHLYQQKINNLIVQSQNYSINRSFYQLLTNFAIYLTDLQSKKRINIDLISFFATCPSPYIIKQSTKPYTLVIDLDETLLYSTFNKHNNNVHNTLYRPGCYDFIDQLSKYYQIIIFTTSVQSYARVVTKGFISIDHYLFRQHAIRVKSRLLKDLTRIGRNLSKLVIVDDLPDNFFLQKENGIAIKSWKGDDKDKQLYKLKDFLIDIAKNKPVDIREQLKSYKTKAKDKKISNPSIIIKQIENIQQKEEQKQIKQLQDIKQQNILVQQTKI